MAAHDRSASRPSRPEGGDGDNPDADEAEFLGFSYAWPNQRLPLVLDRATPKGRAGCLKRARPDLCGGRRVTGVPTANASSCRGTSAVLKLRALRASGDFDPYWDFHEACEYERNHAQRYAARTAPPVSEPPPPPSPPRLRRVK